MNVSYMRGSLWGRFEGVTKVSEPSHDQCWDMPSQIYEYVPSDVA